MDVIGLLVALAIFAIVAGVAHWLLQQTELDPHARRLVSVIFVIVLAILAIVFLLKFTGYAGGPILLRP